MASYFGCRPVSMFDTRISLPGRDGDFATSEEDDTDDGTDDDASAGHDKTGSLLWRHIEFFIARNRRPEDPNLLFAKVTIAHTKGEGNRPREKPFIVEREEDPLICLLDHFLYLAVYDNVLVSPKLRTVDNVFGTIVPPRKKSLR
ncbi:hypothetical protein MMC18_001799 [Xylographa bjoerkii]|nr:hypothetical protein [Xylographa bjoerkii]